MTQQQINTAVTTDPPADGINDTVIEVSSAHNLPALVFDASLVDHPNDRFLVNPADAGLAEGDPFYLFSTLGMPGGLQANTVYYVLNATTSSFQLAATYQGSAVSITSTGSGYISICKDMVAVVKDPWDTVLKRLNNIVPDADEIDAMDAAASPSSLNPFVTKDTMVTRLLARKQFILIGPPGSGADFEGDTDEVFTAAIASLTAPGQIYVSPATYTFAAPVTVPSGVYLGAYTTDTFIDAAGTAFTLSGTKAWVDGFFISGTSPTNPLVQITGQKNTVSKCSIESPYVGVLAGGSNNKVIGCKVKGTGLGCLLQGSMNIVEWCSFDDSLDVGAVKVEGNTCSVFGSLFSSLITGYAYYILGASVYDTRIVANHFDSPTSLTKSRDYGTRSVRYGNTPNTLIVNQNNFIEPLGEYVGQPSVNTTAVTLQGAVLHLPIDGSNYTLPNDYLIVKCVADTSSAVSMYVNTGDFEEGTKIYLYNTTSDTVNVYGSSLIDAVGTGSFYINIEDPNDVDGLSVTPTSDPYPVTIPLEFPFVITTNNLTDLFGELDSWVQAQFEERNYFLYADQDVTYKTSAFDLSKGNIIGSEDGGEVIANQMTWDGTTLSYPKWYIQSVLANGARWVVNAGTINLSAGDILYVEVDPSIVVDTVVPLLVATEPLPMQTSSDTQILTLALCLENSRLIWLYSFREIAGSSGAVEIPFVSVSPPHTGFISWYTFTQSPSTIDVNTNEVLLDTTALGFIPPVEALFVSNGALPSGVLSGVPYFLDEFGPSFKIKTLSTATEVNITAVNSGKMSIIMSLDGLGGFEWLAFLAGNTNTDPSYIDVTLNRIFVTVGGSYTGHTFHDNLPLFFYMYPPFPNDFAGAMPAGIAATTKYYLVNTVQTSASKYNFQLATTPNGTPITISDKGSLTDYFVLQQAVEVRMGITFSGTGVDAQSHLTFPATYGTPDYTGRMHVKKTPTANKIREYTYYFDSAPPIVNIENGVEVRRLNDGIYRYAVEYTGSSSGVVSATLQVGFDTTYTAVSPPLSPGDLWIVWDFKVVNSTVTEIRDMYEVLSSYSEADFHPDVVEYATTVVIPFAPVAGTPKLSYTAKYTFDQVANIDAMNNWVSINPDTIGVDNTTILPISDGVLPDNLTQDVQYQFVIIDNGSNFQFGYNDGSSQIAGIDQGSGNLSLLVTVEGVSSNALLGITTDNTNLDTSYIDVVNDRLHYPNPNVEEDMSIYMLINRYYSPPGVMPSGLSAATKYYVVNKDNTGFQIAATIGGTPLTINDKGTESPDRSLEVRAANEFRADLDWSNPPTFSAESHLTFPSDSNILVRYNIRKFMSVTELHAVSVRSSGEDSLPRETAHTSRLNNGVYRYSVHVDGFSTPGTVTATMYVGGETHVLTSPVLQPFDLWVPWDIEVVDRVAVGVREMNVVYPNITASNDPYYHPNDIETINVAVPTAGEASFDVDGTPLPIARFVGAYETKNPPLPPSMFGGASLANLTEKASAHSAQLKSLYERTNLYLEPGVEIYTDVTPGNWLSPLDTGLPGVPTDPLVTFILQDRSNAWGLVSGSTFPALNGLFRFSNATQSWTRISTFGAGINFTSMSKTQQGIALLRAAASGEVSIYDPEANTWVIPPLPIVSTEALAATNSAFRPANFPVGGQVDYMLQTEHHTYFKTCSGTVLRYRLHPTPLLEMVPHIYTEAPGDAGLLSHSLKDTGYNVLRAPDTQWDSLDNGVSYTAPLPTGTLRSKLLAGNDTVLAEMASTNFAALLVENFSIRDGAWMAVYKTNTTPPSKWYIFGGNDDTSYLYDVLPSSNAMFSTFRPMQWLADPLKQEAFILGTESNVFKVKRGRRDANGVWTWVQVYSGATTSGCVGTFDYYEGGSNVGDIYILLSGSPAVWVKYTALTDTWSSTNAAANWSYTYSSLASPAYTPATSNLLGYGAASPLGVGFLVTDSTRASRPTLFFYNRSSYSVTTLGDTGATVTLPLAVANSATAFYGAAYHAASNTVFYVARSSSPNANGTTTLFAHHASLTAWSAVTLGTGASYKQTFINRTGNLVAVDNNIVEPKMYLLSNDGITTFTLTGFVSASPSTIAIQTPTGTPAFSMITSSYISQAGALRGGEANVLMGSWVKEFPVRYAGFGLDAGVGGGIFWTDAGFRIKSIKENIWAGINRDLSNGYLWIADASKSVHPYELKDTSTPARGNVVVAGLGTLSNYDYDIDTDNNRIGFVFKENNNSSKLAFLLWDIATAMVVSYQKAFSATSYNFGDKARIVYSGSGTWVVMVQNAASTLDVHRRSGGGTWTSFTPAMAAGSGYYPSKPMMAGSGDVVVATCDVNFSLYVHYFTPSNTMTFSSGPLGFSGFLLPEIFKAGSTYWVAGSSGQVAKSTSYTSGFSVFSNPVNASYSRVTGVSGYAYSSYIVVASVLSGTGGEMGIFTFHNDNTAHAFTFAAQGRTQSSLYSGDEELYGAAFVSFTQDGKLLYGGLRPGRTSPHYSLRISRNGWQSLGDSCLGSGRLLTIGDRCYREEFTDDELVTDFIYEYDAEFNIVRKWNEAFPIAERDPGNFTALRYPNRADVSPGYTLLTGNPTDGLVNDTSSPTVTLPSLPNRAFPYIGGQTRIQGGVGASVLHNGAMLLLKASYLPAMGTKSLMRCTAIDTLKFDGTFSLKGAFGSYSLNNMSFPLGPSTVGKHLVLEWNTPASLILDAAANPLTYWTDLNYPQGKIVVVLGEVREKAFVLYPILAMHTELIKLSYASLEKSDISDAIRNISYCAPASQYCIHRTLQSAHEVTPIAVDSLSVREVGTLHGFQKLEFGASPTALSMNGKHLVLVKGLPPKGSGYYYYAVGVEGSVAGEEGNKIEPLVGEAGTLIVVYT